MNLILLFPEDFHCNGMVTLEGKRAAHIHNIIRPAIGDELTVGLINSQMGKGTVTSLSTNNVCLKVHLHINPPPPLQLKLILALPRPKVLRRTIAACSAMGVKDIVLINSYRVEKSYWQSPLLDADNLRQQMITGLEQAKDTILPTIRLAPLFKPFVEDGLQPILKNTLPLLAHPYATEAIPQTPHTHITLAIGPEGGFIPYEVKKLAEMGFQKFSLGPRILKVETAIPAVLSKLF